MSVQDWVDRDFYRELGVSSDASADEIKRAYRKIAREKHPDVNPGNAEAEAKFKAAGEAYGVLSDPHKRQEYDEARALFAQGSGGRRGFGGPTGSGFADGPGGGFPGGFDLGDLFEGLFDVGSARGAPPWGAGTRGRGQRGTDVEAEVRIEFSQAVRGTTLPLRLSSPTRCRNCHGTGARPGSSRRTCPTCGGAGIISRSQGTFAFSEPCRDCRGQGSVVGDPCPECGGDGVTAGSRSLTVRVPPGVDDGQRIRLAGQGQQGHAGGPAGDLYVVVHVNPHPVFARSDRNRDDLTVTVPVTFPELVQGATITVPTLDGTVSLEVPPGTDSGRTLRVRGKGIRRKNGRTGDLLVTLHLVVPTQLNPQAAEALAAYAEATRDHDPRATLLARAGYPAARSGRTREAGQAAS